MKTLIIKYLPRGERSHTKKLLDAFLEEAKGQDIEILDIAENLPDMFNPVSLIGYLQRNYGGQKLSDAEAKSLARMDEMTAQLKLADIVVLATPMYNFSLPAAVKAWFDSVMLKGETWDMSPDGYKGLMTGKKALILMASGGVYEGDMSSWEHAMSLAKIEFQFMGFDEVKGLTISGANMDAKKLPEKVEKGKAEIKKIVEEWY
ncbi:MAG: NAD(P)H-dependent oxidoreductase [Nanoarchaeota archaeon]|nr:NAD(P)H-dependent oxidoreductase [Nanoarchaeota archaeon]